MGEDPILPKVAVLELQLRRVVPVPVATRREDGTRSLSKLPAGDQGLLAFGVDMLQ